VGRSLFGALFDASLSAASAITGEAREEQISEAQGKLRAEREEEERRERLRLFESELRVLGVSLDQARRPLALLAPLAPASRPLRPPPPALSAPCRPLPAAGLCFGREGAAERLPGEGEGAASRPQQRGGAGVGDHRLRAEQCVRDRA
jgi:hypothetical protein